MTPLYAAVDMHTLGSTFGRPDPPITVIDGSVGIVKMLLEYGANPNATLKTRVLKRVYNAGDARLGEGATALMRAARGGDVALMRLLLQHGANPALQQKNGNTPMMLAASLSTKGNYPDRGSEESAIEAISSVSRTRSRRQRRERRGRHGSPPCSELVHDRAFSDVKRRASRHQEQTRSDATWGRSRRSQHGSARRVVASRAVRSWSRDGVGDRRQGRTDRVSPAYSM